jgi:hypothetical protein
MEICHEIVRSRNCGGKAYSNTSTSTAEAAEAVAFLNGGIDVKSAVSDDRNAGFDILYYSLAQARPTIGSTLLQKL